MKKSILYDITGILGTGLVGYGLQTIYPPLSFIFVGIVLLAYAIFGAKAEANHKRKN